MSRSVLKNMAGMKALVTGGMGFIGSNLVHRLVELGAEVTVYDALLEGYGGNWVNIKEVKDRVNVVIGDVRDYDKLKKNMKGKDVIFHCAAQLSRIYSMTNPYLDIDINCIGTINVLEVARKIGDKNAKIVYTGSRASAGRAEHLPVDECTLDNPLDIYGANKLAAEKYCMVYYRAYGLKTVALRLNNCYGPRAQMKTSTYGVFNWFVRLALEDKNLTVYEPGTQLRDYNYIDDVIDALILVAQSDNAVGEVFYLGTGKPISLIELAKLIVKTAGSGRVEIVPWPKEWKVIEIGDFYVTYEKIKDKLGWYPETDLGTGLKKTIQFYKERLHKYK